LPEDYSRETEKEIMAEYTTFKSKAGSFFALPMTWEAGTVRDPLNWWTVWAKLVPHLREVAAPVMKLLVRFAAGERSFSNAFHIQSLLRTRLSHTTLHMLLHVYYNSRVVPDVPASVLPSLTAPLDSRMHTVELDGVEYGADDPDGCLDASDAVGAVAADVEGGPVGELTSADHSADDDSPPGTQFSASH